MKIEEKKHENLDLNDKLHISYSVPNTSVYKNKNDQNAFTAILCLEVMIYPFILSDGESHTTNRYL